MKRKISPTTRALSPHFNEQFIENRMMKAISSKVIDTEHFFKSYKSIIHRFIVFFLFLFFSTNCVCGQINVSNYQSMIGKKIKFSENLTEPKIYKIANKKLSVKKYFGKTLVISNIEKDKKENLVVFLTETLENNREKTIKIKTKTQDVKLENISIIYPKNHLITKKKVIPQKTKVDKKYNNFVSKRNSLPDLPEYSADEKTDSKLYFPWIVILILGVIFLLNLLKKRKQYHLSEAKTDSEYNELLKEVGGSFNSDNLIEDSGRGEPSERELVRYLCDEGFSKDLIFHDLYVPTKNGKFSQIDLVLLSRAGIIVFEVKDYSGWIFGNSRYRKWVQVLNYGREKYYFYNPIIQNEGHINFLRRYLKKNIPFFSVIVFYGACELKEIDFVPKKTFITTPQTVFKAINEICWNNPEVQYDSDVSELLKKAVLYGENSAIKEGHIKDIKDMLGKDRVFK